MAKDWVDDENLSREETLKRFEALEPQATRGPNIPAGGRLEGAPATYGGPTLTRTEIVTASPVVSRGRQLATA